MTWSTFAELERETERPVVPVKHRLDPQVTETTRKLRALMADVQSAVDHYRLRPSDAALYQVVYAVDGFAGELAEMLPDVEDPEAKEE